MQDDRPHVPQRAEDRRRDKLHRDQLARGQLVPEDQPEQNKQDGLLQEIKRSSLEKRKCAHAARLIHFQVIDLPRSEEHTSELQSLMRISYAVFCLKKTTHTIK